MTAAIAQQAWREGGSAAHTRGWHCGWNEKMSEVLPADAGVGCSVVVPVSRRPLASCEKAIAKAIAEGCCEAFRGIAAWGALHVRACAAGGEIEACRHAIAPPGLTMCSQHMGLCRHAFSGGFVDNIRARRDEAAEIGKLVAHCRHTKTSTGVP